jgi:hypothetical protein
MILDFTNGRLRASDTFVLLGFDELTPAEQDGLATLREDPNFYGILKPVNRLLPAKSVSKEAALLFLTLRRPQRIPALLASIFGDDPSPLFGLLADGVLEVEHDGAFVSGPDALLLFQSTPLPCAAPHPLAALSSAAIAYAASYEGLDASALADKVYAFGRQPCTEAIRHRFAKNSDLMSFLVAEPGVSQLLSSVWASLGEEENPWLSWSTRNETQRLGYKLYVSPRLDAMPSLFGMTVRAMKRAQCQHFKIGRRGEGVCRPDKMVAYFASLDQLRQCASLIESDLVSSEISPRSAHGVPFTAPIDGAGFLSWGMDPPELVQVGEEFAHQSFRQWVAGRVAIAVLSAKGAKSPTDVVPSVLRRVELDGIDPNTWAPNLAIWREHAASAGDVA